MKKESSERRFYIRDGETSGTYKTELRGQGRVRRANSAENALRRYLNDAYSITQRTSNMPAFVPRKNYEVFLLSDLVIIEVTPVRESPFTLETIVPWERT